MIIRIAPHTYSDVLTPKFPLWRAVTVVTGALLLTLALKPSHMKKTFKRLHFWLAVPFGLVIALICFSGAMIEFAGEISECAYHDLYEAQVSSQGRLSLPELVQRVEPHLEPGVTITGVSIPNDSTRNYEFNLSAPPRTEWLVDPYTGRVAGPKEHLPFFEVMFKLHRWLLDFPHEGEGIWWGKLIVGVSTLMFLFALITGLVAFWPRTTRGLRKQLTIHLRRGRERRWFDLHTIGGAYLFVLLLAMAVTGLTWSFDWYKKGFYKVLGAEPPQRKGGHGGKQKGGKSHPGRPEHGAKAEAMPEVVENACPDARTYAAWQAAADQLRQKYPTADAVEVNEEGGSVSLGEWGNVRATDHYRFDSTGHHVTEKKLYATVDRGQRIRGWIYSVHTGRWGGWPMRIIQFFAALFGTSLPLSGYYLWWKRTRKRKASK